MPKNVMKLVKPSPHRERNAIDLSHRHVMSLNTGELIPATTIETVPGDHIELSCADLIRAIPMVTSPFLRAKQHIDVWFVPYKDLWHNFDNFMTKKSQPVSSALNSHNYAPWVSVYDLRNAVHELDGSDVCDIVGRSIQDVGFRLLNYLGYGFTMTGSVDTMPKVNLWRLAAYNYIWYNEYRQTYYDDGTYLLPSGMSPANLFNFDNLLCDTLAHAEVGYTLTDANRIRLLGSMCQMRYRCWKKDLYTGLLPSTQFGNVSTIESNLSQIDDFYLKLKMSGTSSNYQSVNVAPSTGSHPFAVGTVGGQGGSTPVNFYPFNAYDALDNGNKVGMVSSSQSLFSMLDLRKAEAIQIWRENALRAGNRVKDNMTAHYGVESGTMVTEITFNTIMSSHVILNTISSTQSIFTPNLNGFSLT